MLSRSQGNGAAAAAAFSTFALPAARRLPQQQQQQQQQPFYWNLPAPAVEAAASIGTFSSTNPFLATGVSSSSSSSSCSTTSSLLRKRPGCECNSSSLSSSTSYDHLWSSSSGRGGAGRETEESPLDLSKPKIKVRQHWSGGSIVEINTESAVVSIQQQQQQQHPSTSDNHSDSICACDSSSSGAPVKVSVIQERRQQHQQPDQLSTSPWASAQRASRSSTYGDFLRVEIQWRHQPEATAARPLPQSPTQSAELDQHTVVNKPQVGPKRNSLTMTSAAAAAPLDDDLNRLADSAHQLRLSGFYYGHLSWKESAQLLQNTRVGTFLVRDSSDARYLYALSLQTDKGPTSVRIHYSIQGFRLDASSTMANPETLPRFRTVLDLVDHYVAKWSHCRDKGQFWLNTDGQVHSEVILTRPLIRSCQSLQHLCRLVYNKNPSVQPKDAHTAAAIPPAIRSYLKDYPFQH